jgi:hypothetical protein
MTTMPTELKYRLENAGFDAERFQALVATADGLTSWLFDSVEMQPSGTLVALRNEEYGYARRIALEPLESSATTVSWRWGSQVRVCAPTLTAAMPGMLTGPVWAVPSATAVSTFELEEPGGTVTLVDSFDPLAGEERVRDRMWRHHLEILRRVPVPA